MLVLARRRRPARALLAPAVASVLALSLTACGGEADEGSEGFDAVEISGSFGTTPEFDFSDTLVAGEEEQQTLIEGDGVAIADGDQVLLQLTVANGFSRRIAFDSHSATDPGFVVTAAGSDDAQPQAVGDLFADYIGDHIEPGMSVGTRFALTVGVEDAFPDYVTAFSDYDIGNADGLVMVTDVVGIVGDSEEIASGKMRKAPSWAPTVGEKKGVPTGLDFADAAAPSGEVRVATLIQGDGAAVTEGSAVVVNYLGQLADADKPFDESFSAERTLTALVGADTEQFTSTATPVIKGWTEGLVGVPTGSRVIIEIPPKLGYGKKGSGEDIPGGSTLYFLIDVLGAA